MAQVAAVPTILGSCLSSRLKPRQRLLISPGEVRCVDFERIECPACGKQFAPLFPRPLRKGWEARMQAAQGLRTNLDVTFGSAPDSQFGTDPAARPLSP
jgi:hypothetical protein